MDPKGKGPKIVIRDRYTRPVPVYNDNYDLYKEPREDLPSGYSPYVPKEPLFNNRAAIIENLPKYSTLTPPSKKPRTI
jgi:hypothetical protein